MLLLPWLLPKILAQALLILSFILSTAKIKVSAPRQEKSIILVVLTKV